eukprot:COSAG01_NODE_534_length_15805_cov_9.468420_15_plen_109_part_00
MSGATGHLYLSDWLSVCQLGAEILLATMRRAEEMYNYTSYPTLILFRGDSGGTNAQTVKCKYKEGDNKPGAAIHPGTRKDCWEFYGALTAALSLAAARYARQHAHRRL